MKTILRNNYMTYNWANSILVGNIELTLVILGEIGILDITP